MDTISTDAIVIYRHWTGRVVTGKVAEYLARGRVLLVGTDQHGKDATLKVFAKRCEVVK